ncbi:MAG: DUF1972 domain-containing protein [Chitinophagaceae bacterium]
MKIGILGTRGIPNHYGGFEQFASYLSAGLVTKGHEVYVYNSHNHYYQQNTWNQVNIVHCYDPEYKLGSAGQFIYDLNCILDARTKNFDILLMLGYTSSSVWGKLYPKKTTIVYNMDGMEWKRNKYSEPVKKFLFYAEKLAVKYSDFIVADSRMIQSYIQEKYTVPTQYIPYGAQIFDHEDENLLKEYHVTAFHYYISMGRMVCENNLEIILDGFTSSNSTKKFLVISDPDNKFGKHLTSKYKSDDRIIFTGTIFDEKYKHTLKYFSQLYFHGHSVGGTNPCLLEAMASSSLIAAHDNVFNNSILGDDGLYFSTPEDVKSLIENTERGYREEDMINNNLQKIQEQYNWGKVIDQYENFMVQCVINKSNERNVQDRRHTYQ